MSRRAARWGPCRSACTRKPGHVRGTRPYPRSPAWHPRRTGRTMSATEPCLRSSRRRAARSRYRSNPEGASGGCRCHSTAARRSAGPHRKATDRRLHSADPPGQRPGIAIGGECSLLFLHEGLARHRMYVIKRHDLQLWKRLVHHGWWPVRRDDSTGRIHGEWLDHPALVVVPPESHVVVQLAELPRAVIIEVLVLVDPASPAAFAVARQLHVAAPAGLRSAVTVSYTHLRAHET